MEHSSKCVTKMYWGFQGKSGLRKIKHRIHILRKGINDSHKLLARERTARILGCYHCTISPHGKDKAGDITRTGRGEFWQGRRSTPWPCSRTSHIPTYHKGEVGLVAMPHKAHWFLEELPRDRRPGTKVFRSCSNKFQTKNSLFNSPFKKKKL